MSIIFKKIRYQNFLSSGNIFTEIELNKSQSTLVIGENGAGKSTMLDALSYVLYNKAFRNINKPQLINSMIGKNLLVEIEFTVGQKDYLVRRGMKPNIFEIYENDKLIDQSAASKDYQQILERDILKLNQKSFNQIIILGSANFTPFMKLRAHERREVIEDLLDIQVFSVMNSLLKERVNTNRSDLIDTDNTISLVESKIEMNKKHLESLKTNNEELITKQKEKISEYILENDFLSKQIETKVTQSDDLVSTITESEAVQKKITELQNIRKKLENRIKKAEKEIVFYSDSDTCQTCKQSIDENFKQIAISKRKKVTEEVTEALDKLDKTNEKLSSNLEKLQERAREYKEIKREINELLVKVKMNNNFVNTLQKEIRELEQKFEKQEENYDLTVQLEQELEISQKKKERLISDAEVYNMAGQLLKDGGIKTKIIRQYIPVMNKLINKYLAAMDFFIEFTLDENFEEKIKSRFRDEFSYESFSEGEKLRIDLSLLFAWRAIAKLRNSAATNLLIMDEIFDSSLDAGGTEEFMKILETVAQDTNVFIISHKTDQLVDKFDDIIRFNKVKNFSKMVV